MKHFLPSSVMLTPFVVRYYDEEDDQEIVETKANAQSQYPNIKEQQTEISD
ncbi:hypothetical protein ACNPJX_002232 [Vibrio parahaemolyticus]|uniref:hypothetical protein n=1 Tax=Vibrio parahaemolyticus TaxID=670 RepID=UPI0009A9C361|nr:hypothetical protein [Vibrio parahaemolyticus]EGQ9696314.1 hypothetical protein [Vibrio parahaemolyticus]EGR1962356.1 hypothetical protein [Vibrio parahaemolyticus]EGR1968191.1 hypothetical protein [Vibrio parahaemolyticus]EHR6712237.1 hypothetical protein [Vibrio parahaemolyticus]EIV1638206.1 hypothetical protein [Vibrio parahaemolyticus]